MLEGWRRSAWFRCLAPQPRALARLFCFPETGGAADSYRGWHGAIPRVETVAVQLPGRQERSAEALLPDMERLVAAVGQEIIPWLDRPFVLFGHSLGSLVAFELAHWLRPGPGPAPIELLLSAAAAPGGSRLRRARRPFDRRLLAVLCAAETLPPAQLVGPELANHYLPVLKGDLLALAGYAPAARQPLACDITSLGGRSDPFVSARDLDRWAGETSGRFQRRMFEGDHFFVRDNEAAILALIARRLAPILAVRES